MKLRKTCPECNGKPNDVVWNDNYTQLVSAKKRPYNEVVPCPHCDGTGKFMPWLRNTLSEIRNRHA